MLFDYDWPRAGENLDHLFNCGASTALLVNLRRLPNEQTQSGLIPAMRGFIRICTPQRKR